MENTASDWPFEHTYIRLPEGFFKPVKPTKVAKPQLLAFNQPLAESLGLHTEGLDEQLLANIFSGNAVPENARPIAQAYAGHQFGHFTMLGDGRAILLGEVLDQRHQRFDIQLKGAGATPYSRRGDGRATLMAMLREYVISEAMFHLHIPTTRSLAVVVTGEPVYRDRPHAGAVLTRVAASHIRCGTFEYAWQFLGKESLQELMQYTIDRHYPELKEADNQALELLKQVMLRQIDLIVHWMRVGFIHGVMNTDNMSIAGETIDYGPCAFMNTYRPETVYSSIDTAGRYAFGRQPGIAQWNLSVLASALVPLIDPDADTAVELAKSVLNTFNDLFQQRWLEMMGAKLGITAITENDRELVQSLLRWMELHEADYTNTFLVLSGEIVPEQGGIYTAPAFLLWKAQWQQRTSQNPKGQPDLDTMRYSNPVYIPRNHLVEAALESAAYRAEFGLLNDLMRVLANPYTSQPDRQSYQQAPLEFDATYRTFCGT